MDIENQQPLDLHDYIAILRRRKWQLIVPAVLLFAIAVIVALAIPPVYRSSATILIEQQEIPTDLVRSTVTSYADQRVQTISQRVMTLENLGQIIERYGLYPDLVGRIGLSSAVEQMREDLKLDMISADVVDPRTGRPAEATIAFSLAYESPSAPQAQKVANDITTLFLNENIKNRREAAEEASAFLEKETQKLGDRIATLEAKLALFKEEHGDSLPELMSLNLQLLQRTEERLRENEQSIRTLEERKIYLESELAQIDPYSKLYSATGERVLSTTDRLKALEAEYVTVAARYSTNHPDRAKLERELAALRREVGAGSNVADLNRRLTDQQSELAALRKRYSAEHPDVKKLQRSIELTQEQIRAARSAGGGRQWAQDADNPAYVQLQAQLAAAESELASVRQSGSELRAKLDELENRIAQGPKIEREYRILTRDYDNAVAKYKEVENKQMEAELAEALETERKSERFSLIEPPLLPETPVKPNRLAIVFLGFVFGIAGGVGNVAVREALDNRIYSPRGIRAITGAPPLAVIPYIETAAERRRRLLKTILIAAGLIIAAGLALLAIDLLVMPLDVIWFKLLRKFGIGGVGTA
jgi:uncharacterized protein involved in exopolysaccharide biosynthesis